MAVASFLGAMKKKFGVQLLKMMVTLFYSPCKLAMMEFYYVAENLTELYHNIVKVKGLNLGGIEATHPSNFWDEGLDILL